MRKLKNYGKLLYFLKKWCARQIELDFRGGLLYGGFGKNSKGVYKMSGHIYTFKLIIISTLLSTQSKTSTQTYIL